MGVWRYMGLRILVQFCIVENLSSIIKIMIVSEIERLINELTTLPKETEWVEFKVNNANPQEIGEYISALSEEISYVMVM